MYGTTASSTFTMSLDYLDQHGLAITLRHEAHGAIVARSALWESRGELAGDTVQLFGGLRGRVDAAGVIRWDNGARWSRAGYNGTGMRGVDDRATLRDLLRNERRAWMSHPQCRRVPDDPYTEGHLAEVVARALGGAAAAAARPLRWEAVAEAWRNATRLPGGGCGSELILVSVLGATSAGGPPAIATAACANLSDGVLHRYREFKFYLQVLAAHHQSPNARTSHRSPSRPQAQIRPSARPHSRRPSTGRRARPRVPVGRLLFQKGHSGARRHARREVAAMLLLGGESRRPRRAPRPIGASSATSAWGTRRQVTTISTVGYGDITQTNSFELFFSTFIIVFGVAYFSYILSILSSQIESLLLQDALN